MATLTIRKLDDDVVAALKARARRNQQSLEAELREILSDAVSPVSTTSLRDLADQIATLTPGGAADRQYEPCPGGPHAMTLVGDASIGATGCVPRGPFRDRIAGGHVWRRGFGHA